MSISPFAPTPTGPKANASSSASPGLSEAASGEMGKDEFLKLLVTQLGNQDPMNPMKGQEFAAQLAQFTSVEQLTNISGQLGQQQGAQQALTQSVNSGVAAGLIGRTVEAEGSQITWNGEDEATLGLDLQGAASEVTVTIRNAAGAVVQEQTLENVPAGAEEIKWDGTGQDGSRVPEGEYSFEVTATDAQGDAVPASPYLRGNVDRVTFGQNGTMLWVNGTEVSMGRVRSVATP